MKKKSLKELGRLTPQEFKTTKRNPVVIVLDNIRSALNVGSAFRTADAFAFAELHLCGITATPPHREILKTAIGATAAMPWTYFEQTTDSIKQLKEQGYQVIGVEQTHESVSLLNFEFKSNEKYALVFGNEVEGVSEEVLLLLDNCVEIPQFGTKHSLNISVCVGVLGWEVLKGLKSTTI
ncbi:MAG: RNA methyltransferase [Saprospiraceae bacterium]